MVFSLRMQAYVMCAERAFSHDEGRGITATTSRMPTTATTTTSTRTTATTAAATTTTTTVQPFVCSHV